MKFLTASKQPSVNRRRGRGATVASSPVCSPRLDELADDRGGGASRRVLSFFPQAFNADKVLYRD